MSDLVNLAVSDNPEMAVVSAAANYGPIIATLMTAIIIFLIGMVVLFTEKSSHVPGILLMVLTLILGAEGMYLMYGVYKRSHKKSN
jgi:hypothetical protein